MMVRVGDHHVVVAKLTKQFHPSFQVLSSNVDPVIECPSVISGFKCPHSKETFCQKSPSFNPGCTTWSFLDFLDRPV